MSRDKILIEVFEDKLFRGYSASFCPHLVDEMLSELVCRYADMDIVKLTRLYESKELKYYSIAVLRNMVYNKYDPFNKEYILNLNVEINDDVLQIADNCEDRQPIDLTEEERLLDDVANFLKDRAERVEGKWYDEKLFGMYFNNRKSFRDISKNTGIPTSSVYHNVKGTQDLIHNEFKERYDNI